ncbi:MAG TPA: hypothetical protein DD490_17750, partial [Acidobacteria bacterium]|nr:hypothetical protein [Acidobacteriota bacterium]
GEHGGQPVALGADQLALGALGLALAVVVALAAWGFVAQRRANQALALADVGKAWFLREDNPAHALAHLARALRTEPDNAAAQSLLGDLLLARNWPLPIGELRLGGTGLVEISPDGRLAAAAGEDGTIRLWDTETLQPVGTVRQTEAVESLDLGAGGRRVLALSPGTARLWDTAAGRELWSLDLGDHSSALLSPDGRRLAWSRDGQSLHLRDLDTGTTREIPLPVPPDLAPFGGFETFSFSPDSRTILASDGILTLLWEVEGVRSLPGPGAEAMQAVRFTPDSRYVLVSGDDQTDLWNPATAAGLRIGGSATQAWLSPAGDRALTYGREQELRVWDVTNPDRPLATVPLRDLAHAEVSTDGKLLLTVSDEGVSLWETDTGRPVSEPLCDCAHGRFRAGTRHVVTGDDSGVVRIWRPEPTHTATDLVRSAEGLLDPLFSRDGSRVAIRARDGAFRLWDTDAVQPAGPPLRGLEAAAAGDLGLSTDGRFLLERRGDTYRFWDTGTGQPVWHPLRIPEADKGSAETLAHLHLSPALELFGLKSDERTVQLWSLANGRQTAILQPGHAILYFTFTPAGDRLLTAGANGVLRTWDARTGRPLGEDIPHEGTTFTLDVSPDGGRVVTGTRRGLVRIWDLATGRLLTQLVRHRRPVESVRFQGDGRLVLVRDLNLLRVWDSQTGLPASTIVQTDGIIWQTRLDPSGSRLLVSSKDEPIRLLDARFGQPLTVTPLPSSPSTTARFSPNGQLLWTVNSTEVHVFTVPLFPKRDRDLLVRWAEAVAGWTLDADGRPVELNDQLARLDALRRDTAGAPLGGLGAASLVRWFLADPAARTASPVFDRPQAD